jgi:hypothetical protein
LPIGRASGSASETRRSVICSPARRWGDLPADVLGQLGLLLQSPSRGQLGLSAAAAGPPARLGGQRAGLADRAPDELPGLAGELEHLCASTAGAPETPPDGAADQPQPSADRPRAVLHPPRAGTGDGRGADALARQPPRAVKGQGGVRGPPDIGLNDGRVAAHRPRREAPFALRLGDQHARDLLDHFRAKAADELADRRLVRHRRRQRQPAKAPQMQRVRDLADQRLITPTGALLDHHHAHEQRHRDRRPATLARRDLPARGDWGQQRRIAQQLVQTREVPRRLVHVHLDRQRLIEQRLDLLTNQT